MIVAQRDGAGARVFPIGGTRVLAYPAPHYAVADGAPRPRLRATSTCASRPGRERARVKAAGEALIAAVRAHFAPLFAQPAASASPCRSTKAQPVFDAKHSNLHPLFARRR